MARSHSALVFDDATFNSNTAFDGTGSIGDLIPVHATDHRVVTEIQIAAKSNTDSNTIRLYLHNGSAYIPYEEVLVAAVASPGAGIERWSATLRPLNLTLPPTWKLGVSVHTLGATPANEFFFHADFELFT